MYSLIHFLVTIIVLSEVHSKYTKKSYFDLREADQHFAKFMKKYNVKYGSHNEMQERYKHFKNNLKNINLLNNSSKSAVFGITKFADTHLGAVRSAHKCLKYERVGIINSRRKAEVWNETEVGQNRSIPDKWDWRRVGAVTRARSQGQCSSCWAFGTTSVVESRTFMKYRKLMLLSPQQLLDCSNHKNNCGGGTPHRALEAAIKFGGMELEKEYPYLARRFKCWADKRKIVTEITDYNVMENASEEEIRHVVYNRGPVVLGVSQGLEFNFYRGGIVTANELGCKGDISHALTIVGYNIEGDSPYWILKNSVGEGWGERGFLKMHMGSNACKMTEYVVEATIG